MTSPDPTAGTLDAIQPLGVYVHFPFCRARCPYCDFATAVREPIPHDEYAAAVIAELSARAPWFRNTNPPGLKSIYFGGGTPGL
jgi:oxygen-independent coproporphyrinogen-3 oxidase